MSQKPVPKKYRSGALRALHESVQGLHRLGLVDTKTMRQFDTSCVTPVDAFTPQQIARK
jgi:putative transcriptional regulator